MITSTYVENLVNGRCPNCGNKLKDDANRPMMLVCPNKACGYEIDTVTYFEIIDEYYPPAPDNPNDDPEINQQQLNNLEL